MGWIKRYKEREKSDAEAGKRRMLEKKFCGFREAMLCNGEYCRFWNKDIEECGFVLFLRKVR